MAIPSNNERHEKQRQADVARSHCKPRQRIQHEGLVGIRPVIEQPVHQRAVHRAQREGAGLGLDLRELLAAAFTATAANSNCRLACLSASSPIRSTNRQLFSSTAATVSSFSPMASSKRPILMANSLVSSAPSRSATNRPATSRKSPPRCTRSTATPSQSCAGSRRM